MYCGHVRIFSSHQYWCVPLPALGGQMTRLLLGTMVLSLALVLGCDEDDDSGSGPATTADETVCGSYALAKTPVSTTGVCGGGVAENGTATIEAQGSGYTLTITDVVCSPAAACLFSGMKTDTGYVFGNSGAADDQGGVFTNDVVLAFDADTNAAGTMVSTYGDGSGVLCTWTTAVTLTRQ